MTSPTDTNHSTVPTIKQAIVVKAPVEKVFRALLDVNAWWARRLTGNPEGLRLEASVGGRFWETRDGTEENGILWGTVTSIEPNDHLQLSGPIGMRGAVLGNVVICTNRQDDATTEVTLSHEMTGNVPEGAMSAYTGGWEFLLGGLKRFSETGERVPPPSA
jgi:uncharacterized protein YndB with AHSA1/START domain